MITVVPLMKAGPGWSPPPYQSPAFRPRLSQSVITTPTTPPGSVMMPIGEPPKPPFIDSALVSAIMSGLGATGYGILSYAFNKASRHTWSKIFFGLSAIFVAKSFYDIYNIRYK